MKIHHIGYYVKNIDEAIEIFQKLGYKISSECFFDETRKIFIQFLENHQGGGYRIELIAESEGCELFGKKFKKFGSTPYHICYECEEMERTLEELQKENFILIREPQPASAINNRRVAFRESDAVGQIELLET